MLVSFSEMLRNWPAQVALGFSLATGVPWGPLPAAESLVAPGKQSYS